MRTIRETVYVHRPAKEVWAYLVDWPRYAEWDSTFVAAKQLPGISSSGGPRLRWTMRVLGRRLAMDSEFVEWDPPRHMTYAATEGPAPVRKSRGWFDVAPAGDGCIVEAGYQVAAGAGRAVRGLADPVLLLWGSIVTRRDLRRLRAALEHGASPSAATPLHVDSVRIHRDADEVWSYLTDFSHQRDWDGLTAACAVIGDEPLRDGTRFRWVVRLLGRDIALETRLTAWDPPRRMDYAVTSGPVRGSGWTQVHPAEQGCVVERGQLASPGIGWVLAKVPDAMLVAWIARLERRNLARLRNILEGHSL